MPQRAGWRYSDEVVEPWRPRRLFKMATRLATSGVTAMTEISFGARVELTL